MRMGTLLAVTYVDRKFSFVRRCYPTSVSGKREVSSAPATGARNGQRCCVCAPAGLEVRVAFGEVWKESLTELSGGQRSLLALSLILAMLLFKPAPIYILDEVLPPAPS